MLANVSAAKPISPGYAAIFSTYGELITIYYA